MKSQNETCLLKWATGSECLFYFIFFYRCKRKMGKSNSSIVVTPSPRANDDRRHNQWGPVIDAVISCSLFFSSRIHSPNNGNKTIVPGRKFRRPSFISTIPEFYYISHLRVCIGWTAGGSHCGGLDLKVIILRVSSKFLLFILTVVDEMNCWILK